MFKNTARYWVSVVWREVEGFFFSLKKNIYAWDNVQVLQPPTFCILPPPLFLPVVPTGPPQQVAAQPSDATTLVIQWQPPLDLHRNGIIRRYIVNITELDTSTLLQYFTTDLNITVPSLHPFYQYGYTVSAETIGVGPFSDTSIIHMPEAGRYMWCAYSND